VLSEDDLQEEKKTMWGVLSLLFTLKLSDSAPSALKNSWAGVLREKMCLIEELQEFREDAYPSYSENLHSKYVFFNKKSMVLFARHVVDRVVLMPDIKFNWGGRQRQQMKDTQDFRFWVNWYIT